MHSQDADSKLYNRKCYGYIQGDNGELVINENEAEVVRFIFDRYTSGASVKVISKELMQKSIPSPTGKEKWSNRTIDTILQNEKYTGTVYLFKTVSGMYPNVKGTRIMEGIPAVTGHHEAIITEEKFNKAKNRRLHIQF